MLWNVLLLFLVVTKHGFILFHLLNTLQKLVLKWRLIFSCAIRSILNMIIQSFWDPAQSCEQVTCVFKLATLEWTCIHKVHIGNIIKSFDNLIAVKMKTFSGEKKNFFPIMKLWNPNTSSPLLKAMTFFFFLQNK